MNWWQLVLAYLVLAGLVLAWNYGAHKHDEED